MLIVNQIVDSLFREFNYGKSETRRYMPFCRFAVEKYIFEKLYSRLFNMYEEKHQETNEKFRKKQQQILNKYTKIDILKFLDVSYYSSLHIPLLFPLFISLITHQLDQAKVLAS